MSPAGSSCFSSDHGVVPGTSSQYTLASRTRRAISWLNCDPKSRTRTVCPRAPPFAVLRSWAAATVMLRSALPHTHVLGLLEDLALRGDRRRDHHFHVLELGDVAGAAHAECRAQRTCEVLASVVDARRTEEDLVQGRLRTDVDPGAAWQIGIGCGHAPVETFRGGFLGARQWCSDHHSVRARRERLADVRSDAHAAIGDHRHAHSTSAHVLVAGGSDVGGRSHLRNANPQHATRGAGGAGTDAHENAGDARLHKLQRRFVVHAVADDDRDVTRADELLERKLVIGLRRVARSEHRSLHHEDVGSGFLYDLRAFLGASRDGRDRAQHAGGLDRLDALGDEVWLDRFAIHLFEQGVDLRLVRLGDPLDDRSRILVSRVYAVEVQHCDRAELSHRDREVDVDHTVHGRAPDGEGKLEAVAHRKGDVDLVGIQRDAAGDQRYFVEPISASRPPADPNLKARLLPGNRSAGFEPALMQGVFTPMVAGFAELYGMPMTQTWAA